MNYLVTGGAGYIGSQTVRRLADEGYFPVVVDNLSQGHREAVSAGVLEVGDLANESILDYVFTRYAPQGVMHFASLCYVGESVVDPKTYYEQNLGNALALFRVMLRHGVKRFILSSTCAVYGDPVRIPMDEDHPQDPVNPYGETKYFLERILKQYDRAYGLKYVTLRYFNAAGADLDGALGESHDPETHLIPRVLQIAKQGVGQVEIYGDDYPTPDGTCIRDYIHVLDLAGAHVAACRWLASGEPSAAFNLGTGRGYSVKEIVEVSRRITGREIPCSVAARRAGDPAQLIADARKANQVLGWTPRHSDLETIVKSAWTWEQCRTY
jgi:UDP-glucose-4-epimerase GalE